MPQNIIDTAKSAGTFKILGAAIAVTDLVDILARPGPFTIFAPTDDAFAKIPRASLDALLADKSKLKQVLLSHVVYGRVAVTDGTKFKDGDKVRTASSSHLVVGRKGDTVTVDESSLTGTDIDASNGVIHAIDTVMWKS
jgi:uncharacterized surface protein with fasciclin (FAS1) repeats